MGIDPKISRSRAQEARGAALHSGRPTPRSGATPWSKGDVVTGDERIEYKRTDKAQITLKLDDIEANRRNALMRGEGPLFGIEIGGRDYLLVEAETYAAMKEQLRAYAAQLGEGSVLPAVQRPVLPGTRPRYAGPTERGEAGLQRQPRYRTGQPVSDQGGLP